MFTGRLDPAEVTDVHRSDKQRQAVSKLIHWCVCVCVKENKLPLQKSESCPSPVSVVLSLCVYVGVCADADML